MRSDSRRLNAVKKRYIRPALSVANWKARGPYNDIVDGKRGSEGHPRKKGRSTLFSFLVELLSVILLIGLLVTYFYNYTNCYGNAKLRSTNNFSFASSLTTYI